MPAPSRRLVATRSRPPHPPAGLGFHRRPDRGWRPAAALRRRALSLAAGRPIARPCPSMANPPFRHPRHRRRAGRKPACRPAPTRSSPPTMSAWAEIRAAAPADTPSIWASRADSEAEIGAAIGPPATTAPKSSSPSRRFGRDHDLVHKALTPPGHGTRFLEDRHAPRQAADVRGDWANPSPSACPATRSPRSSARTCFLAPLVARLAGRAHADNMRDMRPRRRHARQCRPQDYVRARAVPVDGEMVATPLDLQDSSMLFRARPPPTSSSSAPPKPLRPARTTPAGFWSCVSPAHLQNTTRTDRVCSAFVLGRGGRDVDTQAARTSHVQFISA